MQVDIPMYGYRDVVRVIDNMAKANLLQTDHGGWDDDIALVSIYNTLRGAILHLLLRPSLSASWARW